MADKHDESHAHDAHAGAHADGHDGHEGGHEIDKMPNARLFNLLFGLSGLTLLACIGVIQLFNFQVEAIEETRGEAGSFRVEAYREEMRQMLEGWGEVPVKETDTNTVTERYYMPVAQATKRVLDDPKLLSAGKPYPGWKTSDEQAPAAAPGGKPEPGARPARPTPPTREAPTPEPRAPEGKAPGR